MFGFKLKKIFSIILIIPMLFNLAPAMADFQDNLPNIGTAGAGTLTINQEIEMGDFYLRQLRAGAPMIYDPLLTHYLNTLGTRLARQIDSAQTPFNFFLIRNDQINAFAFFGGNIVIHTGLLRETDTESELAGVFGHEISHITQRHLASALENQRRSAPLTWAATVGSILLAMANTQAGIAALSGTLAGTQQSIISFTQTNEQEADRLGLRLLSKAGFDPQGLPTFMQKLSDKARYMSKPPEMLLTHPLPDSRLADARNRANQLPRVTVESSLDYYLAKVRAMIITSSNSNASLVLLEDYKKGNARQKTSALYGQSFQLFQNKKYDQARSILQPLLTAAPSNEWFIDLMTDIDLAENKTQAAINRLQQALKTQSNNPVLLLNLANSYIQARENTQAASLLHRYTYTNPNDLNGWALLAEVYSNQKQRAEELSARAELAALNGDLAQAIKYLSAASAAVAVGSSNQARYDARIDQLRQLQQRFVQYQRH